MSNVWKYIKYHAVFFSQTELKHTVEHLHEEQERIVKIEAVKKSLEIEVKVRHNGIMFLLYL